jgi:methoxymalonate biosynthesis acyl carrier protein
METAVMNGSVKASIREFISKSINIDGIDDNEDLFDSGIVNSLFSIQLVTFVEKEFDITVTVDDLDIENFKSVNALYSFVKSKIGLL